MGLIEQRRCPNCATITEAMNADDVAESIAAQRIAGEQEADGLRVQLAGAVDAIRTLRAYIGNIEGEGPIRYTEALELCDSILHQHGGQ